MVSGDTQVDETAWLKDTLNLPKTDFPIRPSHKIDEEILLQRWEKNKLSEKLSQLYFDSAQRFILHDGPPYANGHIHLGHAYNKILKDIFTKAYRMFKYYVPVIPGWDCHGLPIEQKVLQEQQGISGIALKHACRLYAQQWIETQRNEFKRLAVFMDWNNPYITMDKTYESRTILAFADLFERGYIERKHKTVAWCFSCKTTLASAEIEYNERKDPSLYVKFTISPETVSILDQKLIGKDVSLLIWTTTPWTLPLNRAVAIHPDIQYCIAQYENSFLIFAANLKDRLTELLKTDLITHSLINPQLLIRSTALHPFEFSRHVPIILDTSISSDEGTACVHIAPGCGPEDYELGVKNGLEIYSPINPDGTYTADIVPQSFVGQSVADGQIIAIKELSVANKIVMKNSIRHNYPHCWRCHQGLIFRATPQWFFNLEHNDIKKRALEAIEHIHFTPTGGKNFLKATIENRWEWCLSRQRSWGVPIPALLCTTCNLPITNAQFIRKIADHVAKDGIEFWDIIEQKTVLELLDIKQCPTCKGTQFKKETDILDVWFDSGISHYAVLLPKGNQYFPADLYLEGVDQYRGWYQSSLLTSLALEGKAAMKSISSHGFTVDEAGKKMSKSLGNVVSPQQIIDKVGIDGLRLWVASIDNEKDAVVSEVLLKNVNEVYRKIRNTCRFLLQNLYDFDGQCHAVPVEKLEYLHKLALLNLYSFQSTIKEYYVAGNFTGIFHLFADYTSTLSASYLDHIKDALYVERSDGHIRRSVQTVIWYILDVINRLLAPLTSCTSELLFDHYKNKIAVTVDSIHELPFFDFDPLINQLSFSFEHEIISDLSAWLSKMKNQWDIIMEIRSAVLKAIEQERIGGKIKHSLEASIDIMITKSFSGYSTFTGIDHYLKKYYAPLYVDQLFKDFAIVSALKFVSNAENSKEIVQGIFISVSHASGTKCPRCWHWKNISPNAVHGCCDRCENIILKFKK